VHVKLVNVTSVQHERLKQARRGSTLSPKSWATERHRHPLNLRCRLRRDDEVREQRTEGLGLPCPRMEGEEVIAEQALLLLPDPIGFENIPPTRGARHNERHGRRVAR